MKTKTKSLLTFGGLAGLAGATLLVVLSGRGYQRPFDAREKAELPGWVVYKDNNERRYTGILKFYREGAQQDVYIDRKPFGSLDAIRPVTYSNTGVITECKERRPYENEQLVFEFAESIGKRAHPALFSRED